MKGKALRKHSLHEKTAASVLLKLFMKLTIMNPESSTILIKTVNDIYTLDIHVS